MTIRLTLPDGEGHKGNPGTVGTWFFPPFQGNGKLEFVAVNCWPHLLLVNINNQAPVHAINFGKPPANAKGFALGAGKFGFVNVVAQRDV